MQKRPSDNTIRISRIIFWLILSWSLYYNLIIQWDAIKSNLFWQELTTTQLEYVKYFFISIGIIPILLGFTNICLLKKKYIRILQIILAVIIFYISSVIVEWPSLDVDSLILLMWIFPLIAWITWKCITSKCMRYAEKVTKIRV
jgi:hypothetical protein